MLEIDQRELDADEFLLNTPSATYDLSKGLDAHHEHDPKDFITKQTTVDPDMKNMEIWKEALNTFFVNDRELIEYVQEITGLAAIGKVCIEALIIAYGEGRNGKSTFWNTISRVLGSYSGNMSADLRLTSIESVMPSGHLILCRPLLLLPPIPPSIRVFSNESTLHMRWPKY